MMYEVLTDLVSSNRSSGVFLVFCAVALQVNFDPNGYGWVEERGWDSGNTTLNE